MLDKFGLWLKKTVLPGSYQKASPQSLQIPKVDYDRTIHDPQVVDDYFEQLRDVILNGIQIPRASGLNGMLEAPKVFVEKGYLAPRRMYFYLQPKNSQGWLFERSGHGWIISRCRKIVEKDLFLRTAEPWDKVTLMAPHLFSSSCRIQSIQTEDVPLSFPVYQQQMVDAVCDTLFE